MQVCGPGSGKRLGFPQAHYGQAPPSTKEPVRCENKHQHK
jgi:hypothetical protein